MRFWGLNFGLPVVYARPDELLLIGVVVGFFRGDPDPHFFEYPTLYLYFLAGVYMPFYARAMPVGQFDPRQRGVRCQLQGELRSVLSRGQSHRRRARRGDGGTRPPDCAAAVGVRAGLLAALFMAVAFLHARDSHYATTDVPMVFFVMAAMLAIVQVFTYRQAFDARLAGVLAGCAMGVGPTR